MVGPGDEHWASNAQPSIPGLPRHTCWQYASPSACSGHMIRGQHPKQFENATAGLGVKSPTAPTAMTVVAIIRNVRWTIVTSLRIVILSISRRIAHGCWRSRQKARAHQKGCSIVSHITLLRHGSMIYADSTILQSTAVPERGPVSPPMPRGFPSVAPTLLCDQRGALSPVAPTGYRQLCYTRLRTALSPGTRRRKSAHHAVLDDHLSLPPGPLLIHHRLPLPAEHEHPALER